MKAARLVLVLALGVFYVAAASQHARLVNTSKARGDQSGYLWDAQQVYWNWHGRTPPALVGERNRMPLYAAFLALAYSPAITDDEYFVVAKRWNIALSLALLGILAAIFFRQLPPLPAANLTVIVGFGYFVFKAGYAQSELLFYSLFFLTFVACWRLLTGGGGGRDLAAAAGAGALAALAHLAKAALLPFVALFAVVALGRAVGTAAAGSTRRRLHLLAVPALVVLVFLAVLAPYLLNSKRTFGHYFYNVNTTFYVWYDTWGEASVGTLSHGDGVGWPTLPPDRIPSAAKYFSTHTPGQIAARLSGGFADMAVRSYRTYAYLPYLVWYAALTLLVAAANAPAVAALVRRRAALAAFLALYGISHLLLIAFYHPISGTGTTRFLIAHLTPFFYTASRFLTHPAVAATSWRVAGTEVRLRHLHAATAAALAIDLAVRIWPRVMTTYGGF